MLLVFSSKLRIVSAAFLRFLKFRSDDVHDRDVALSALEAKKEMEQDQPEINLKHDPTAGLNIEKAVAEKEAEEKRRENNSDLPPGLAAFLPQDPLERARLLAEQRRIERMIQRGEAPQPQDPFVAPAVARPFVNPYLGAARAVPPPAAPAAPAAGQQQQEQPR